MSDRRGQPTTAPLDTTIEIETPEHVRFNYHVVGPARRLVAWLIDLVIQGFILMFLTAILAMFSLLVEIGEGISAGLSLVVLFAMQWGYSASFEGVWGGLTPGKAWSGIRVVCDDGRPLDVATAVLRNLLRAADFLPFGYAVALVVMTRDARFRRLGDLAAGTIVIDERSRYLARPFTLLPPPSQAELAWVREVSPLALEDMRTVDLLVR